MVALVPSVLIVPRGGFFVRTRTLTLLVAFSRMVVFVSVGADPAKRNKSIREMNLSVQLLLREMGTKDWDLPNLTTTAGLDDDSSDDDSSSDDSSDGEGASGSGAFDAVSPESLPGGPFMGDAGSGLCSQPGWFAVFPLELSNPCLLVVGKIVSVEMSGEHGGTVNRFTPASRKQCRWSKYGRGVWSQELFKQGNKLTPNQGTE